MLFLIEYDREKGDVVTLQEFSDAHAVLANEQRLALELELIATGGRREIVLLQSPSLTDLKHTHRRYFATIAELASSANR